jgi:hypothetical protein
MRQLRIVLLAVAVCSFGQVRSPSQTPNSIDRDKSQRDSKQQEQPVTVTTTGEKYDSIAREKNHAGDEWLTIISAAISSLATLAIAILAFFQWRAMDAQSRQMRDGLIETRKSSDAAVMSALAAKESADTANKALHLTQVADLHIFSVTLSPPGHFTAHTAVTLNIKNFGSTRAKKVTHTMQLWVGDEQDNTVDLGKYIIIGPGQIWPIMFEQFGVRESHERLMGIAKGTIRVGFSGQIRFEDIFQESHTIRCKAVYDPVQSEFFIEQYERTD